MNDEAYYVMVMNELKSEPPRPGLWMKALTIANGDEATAKFQYIKLRVDQLKAAGRKEFVENAVKVFKTRVIGYPFDKIPLLNTFFILVVIILGIAVISTILRNL